jgi:MFS family permease
MKRRLSAATRQTFRSLEVRNFRLFFIGQAISQAGTWLQLIAQTLLILRLTDSGVALGLVTAAQFVPTLLLGAWAGVISDRVDKRRLMLVTQTAMMVLALALGVLVLTGHVTVGLVYGLAALTGIAAAFDNPARRAFITELVEEGHITNAVSLNSALMTGSRIVGPALAAILIATVGIGWCFVINGVSFVAVLVGLMLMDPNEMQLVERLPKAKGQIREGLRYLWQHEDLRTAMLVMGAIATLAFNWNVLLPLLAQRSLGGDENTYTVLTTMTSVGALTGSLVIARRTSVNAALLARTAILFGVATMLLAIAPTLPLAALAGVFMGATGVMFLSGTNSLVQVGAAPEMRGRVMALYSVVFLGSTPIGGPLAGWVAEEYGVRVGIAMGAVAAIACGVLAQRALRRQRHAEALGTDEALEPVLEAA